MSINRNDLLNFINELLTPNEFSDYCPNGLQVEGKKEIKKISFAVSATRESIIKTVENRSDCLIVHHGILWNYHGTRPISGPFGKRVIPLIKNDINLLGYHLPLDSHQDIGNAALIATKLGLTGQERFGEYKGSFVGIKGKFEQRIKATDLQKKLKEILNHDVIIATPNKNDLINTLGIITGGASSNWTDALKDGLDAYLTGEISEHNWHEAAESGIHMYAGGHYATEIFGIQALMEKIANSFEVNCTFIPSENPV